MKISRRHQWYALAIATSVVLFEIALVGSGSGFVARLVSGIAVSLFAAVVALLFDIIHTPE